MRPGSGCRPRVDSRRRAVKYVLAGRCRLDPFPPRKGRQPCGSSWRPSASSGCYPSACSPRSPPSAPAGSSIPRRARAAPEQVILVEGGKITAVGPGRRRSPRAPGRHRPLGPDACFRGLVDTHTHLGAHLQGRSRAQLLLPDLRDGLDAAAGHPGRVQRHPAPELGLHGRARPGQQRASTPTRRTATAIEQGWIPGPTLINSGLIIGGMGGQFWPTPEMAKQHDIVYPEYLDADTPDEIVKAVRAEHALRREGHQDLRRLQALGLLGRRDEAVRRPRPPGRGSRSPATCRPPTAPRRAIEAGIWSIEHGFALTDEHHKLMAEKGIFLARHRHALHAVRRQRGGDAKKPRRGCRAPGGTASRSPSRPTWTTGRPATTLPRRAARSTSC